MDKLKETGLRIYKAIFNNDSGVDFDGVFYPIKKFTSSGVRYVDLFGYRFIEQNRNKPSPWGQKAREGSQIMWIIEGRKYRVRIENGEYIELK